MQSESERNYAYCNPALEIDLDYHQQRSPDNGNLTSNVPLPTLNGDTAVLLIPDNKTKTIEKNFFEKKVISVAPSLSLSISEEAKKKSNSVDELTLHREAASDENETNRFFSCPPKGQFGTILSWIAFTTAFYATLVAIAGVSALPRGNLFSLFVLIILAQLGGNLVEKFKLPPLLGMLMVGILLRSVPYVDIIGENIDSKWSVTIRKMALVVILTRAGLGLDAKALRMLSFVVIRVGILPNVVEMLVGAVVSHYLLSFPWLWSFLLGFIFSAVSPSVVVPCMLNLSDRRLGVDKGVPTLIIAALSIDNALSISGIGVFLGIIFSSGSVVWQGFKGPVEILAGIGWGIVMGVLCWNIPNRFEKNYPKFRFYFLFILGLLSVFGSNWLNFGGAGAMGCLTTAFVAEIGWHNQGWSNSRHPVKKNFNFIWKFYQPLLFGLIGTEIQLSALNGMTVAWGLLTLVIGLVCRIATCFLVVQGSALNAKEKLFAALAWFPKATIQAAFGSTALDAARSMSTSEEDTQDMIYGRQVLTLAVLAIVFAAPIGAILIMLTGPKLLNETQENLKDSENVTLESFESQEPTKDKEKL